MYVYIYIYISGCLAARLPGWLPGCPAGRLFASLSSWEGMISFIACFGAWVLAKLLMSKQLGICNSISKISPFSLARRHVADISGHQPDSRPVTFHDSPNTLGPRHGTLITVVQFGKRQAGRSNKKNNFSRLSHVPREGLWVSLRPLLVGRKRGLSTHMHTYK